MTNYRKDEAHSPYGRERCFQKVMSVPLSNIERPIRTETRQIATNPFISSSVKSSETEVHIGMQYVLCLNLADIF